MNYEKAYKEALERAKRLETAEYRGIVEYIFELKESEDEKIRKALIRLFQAESTESFGEFTNKQFIAWLEKQCEEKTVAVDIDQMVDDFSRQEIKGYGIPSMIEVDAYRKGISDVIALHNKRFKCSTNDNCSKLLNKDKTLNNLPKFKVGDWLCANELNNYANLIEVIGIVDIFGKERYTVSRDYDSNLDLVEFDFIEKYYHLWSIQDAKAGDVLMSRAPFIYGKQCSYGGLNWFNGKFVKASNYMFTDSPVHPATKEQRDLLFTKMHEAGYEWDENKLELKKVEPKFKIGDWITNGRYARLIVGINSDWPLYMFKDGTSKRIKDIDKKYHLWTIQDAKDSDILAFKDGTSGVLIYKDNLGNLGVLSHCRIIRDKFVDIEESGWGETLLSPATKEQRDLLFQKMREAGYEWDAEKKELKKIEKQAEKSKTKLKFKVGDRVTNGENTYTIHYIAADCYWVEEHSCVTIPFETQDYWELIQEQVDGFDAELNALLKKYEHLPKEELAECLSFYLGVVQGEQTQVTCPYCKNTNCTYVDGHWFCLDCHREFNTMKDEQKSKWTEEDEDYLNDLESYFINIEPLKHRAVEAADWIKSLKQRIEE